MTSPGMVILRLLQFLFPNPKFLCKQLSFLQSQKKQLSTNQKLMGLMIPPIHILMFQYLGMI